MGLHTYHSQQLPDTQGFNSVPKHSISSRIYLPATLPDYSTHYTLCSADLIALADQAGAASVVQVEGQVALAGQEEASVGLAVPRAEDSVAALVDPEDPQEADSVVLEDQDSVGSEEDITIMAVALVGCSAVLVDPGGREGLVAWEDRAEGSVGWAGLVDRRRISIMGC